MSMRSRGLAEATVMHRVWQIRRFSNFVGSYPWEWKPVDVEDYTSSLLSGPKPLSHSTIRGYHLMIRVFCGFLVDPRYDWQSLCLERFDAVPTQICHPGENVNLF